MTDPTDERLQYVRVINNLPFDFDDRFDGVPVRIPAGSAENIPPDMAAHFFGYHPGATRETMMRHVSKRQGWNTKEFLERNAETGKTKLQEWFDLLEIKAIMYKMVPVEEAPADPAKPIPAEAEGAEDLPPLPKMAPRRVEVNVT